MSVMTPDAFRNGPRVDMRGRPIDQNAFQPAAPQAQEPLQRQAVLDQLGTGPMAQARPAGPVATNAGTFSRGGQVKQLPGADLATSATRLAAGTGAQIAGKIAGNTAAGAAVGSGINIGTDLIADKVRTKEEMPTFGGENGAITDDYGRRFQGTGGGTASGAIRGAGYGANPGLVAATGGLSVVGGAAIGAAIAAAKRHAASAYSDFRVEDAADAIGKQYQQSLGRPASEEEVKGRLVGQGWDPNGGDRWVGEKNLFSQLGDIRNSDEAKQFATRGSVIDQLGTGGGTPAETSVPAGAVAGGGAGAAGDPSAWNTDGYAAPAYVPQQAGAVPAGWDATKWNDPNHQTPKYGVGRILSTFPPTVDGLKAAMPDIEKAYPGTTFNGKDKITVPGVGTVDVLESAGTGGKAWRWGAEGGDAGPAPAQGGGASAADTVDMSARGGPKSDVMDKDTLAQIRAELDRIMRGEAPRQALMEQMGTHG